jgi:hypothetical protein
MGQGWAAVEMSECDLGDARLNRRLGAMLEAIGKWPGRSLPTAFQNWANTKAAYRFFANANVSEDRILQGHFAASALWIKATDGPVLILQGTTEFTFKRAAPEKIGGAPRSGGPPRGGARSIRPACRSSRRRARVGSTTCACPPS